MELSRSLERFKLNKTTYRCSQDFFDSENIEGISSISFGAGLLDVLVQDRGYESTVIIFHAARSKAWRSYPVFSGLNMMDSIHANIVAISDPSIALGLDLAWFAGSADLELQQQLPLLIRTVLMRLTNHRKTIFFGASGGGFAALYYSYFFPNSLAVVTNPQTSIERYTPAPVEEYLRLAWNGRAIADIESCTNLDKLYEPGFANKVAFLQNIQDGHHRDRHLAPWLRSLGNDRHNLFLMLEDWGKGHVAPPVDLYIKLLEKLTTNLDSWDFVLKECGFVQSPTIDFPKQAMIEFHMRRNNSGSTKVVDS